MNGPKKIESNGIKSEKKSNFPFKKQHALLKFAKQIRKDILKINSYRLNGGIMVVDRYPQLQFFGIADGKKIDPIYTKMSKKESELLSIVEDIQPDLIFKLIVPVEISKKRRPEDSIEMLKAKYEILEKIEYKKSKIIKVDATQPLQEELLFIKREIWKNL